MAFVILSAGTLTRSKTHTISSKLFLGLVSGCMFAMLAGGVVLGYNMRGESVEVVSEPVSTLLESVERESGAVFGPVLGFLQAASERAFSFEAAHVHTPIAPERAESASGDNRMLLDHFGELSGRMIQLEVEAAQLAARIDAIKEFEARLKTDDASSKTKSRAAKTPPGRSTGGPLLRPLEEHGAMVLPQFSAVADSEQLTDELARMEQGIERLSDALAELDRIATSLNVVHMSFPGRAPVKGVRVGSRFGNRTDPFTKRRAFHSGLDFPTPKGTPIHASAGGRVIYAAYRRDYGYTVEIDHGADLVTRYAHASKLLVKVGQVVMPGEKIALVGSTGRSSGSHLHFEIMKDGRFMDPSVYLARF
jgi:murein DD-endopeptidase MepM/ murein hydrolase activator NlpD